MSSINFIKFKLIIIFLFTVILFPTYSNSQETLVKIDDLKNYCDNFSKEFLKKKINKIYSLEIDFENDRAWLKNAVKNSFIGCFTIVQ